MIYMVEAGGFHKIGYAKDIDRRVKQMQSGCPHEMTVVKTEEGEIWFERTIHSWLTEYRVRGEWSQLPVWILKLFNRKSFCQVFAMVELNKMGLWRGYNI